MQVGQHVDAFGADLGQRLEDVGHHEGHGAGGMGGGEADVRILEGDAARGCHAQPSRRLEIDVGMRLGSLDVVARGHRVEAVEQAGAAKMVLETGRAIFEPSY